MIDIFSFYFKSEEAQEKLRHIVSVVVANTGATGEVKLSKMAATIFVPYPFPLIQVVLCTYQSPAEVSFPPFITP